MSIRMHKPWLSIAEATGLLRGNLGVYQLANEHQRPRMRTCLQFDSSQRTIVRAQHVNCMLDDDASLPP